MEVSLSQDEMSFPLLTLSPPGSIVLQNSNSLLR